MTPPLFQTERGGVFAFQPTDIPALQRFFEENPEYFLMVNGQLPKPDEASQVYNDVPPPTMAFKESWHLGWIDETGQILGTAHLLSDFLAPTVWHIGLFIVASHLHGSGAAQAFYRPLEDWMQCHGAKWVRLGVVVGNSKAESFWRRSGYTEIRQRTGLAMGLRINGVRVMLKSLAAGRLSDYLSLVSRDQPESP